MTDDQRKSVALEFIKRLERGQPPLDLFAEDAQVYFPKWGQVSGTAELQKLFSDLGGVLSSITYDYPYFNYIIQGDLVVVEGASRARPAEEVEWQTRAFDAGHWCSVFEIRDFKIQRCFVYLDPEEVYASADISNIMDEPVIG
jgi:hypothetical protein